VLVHNRMSARLAVNSLTCVTTYSNDTRHWEWLVPIVTDYGENNTNLVVQIIWKDSPECGLDMKSARQMDQVRIEACL
jgi:hypothetical protein